MDSENMYDGASELRGNYRQLGQWLQQVLATPDTDAPGEQYADIDSGAGVATALAERDMQLQPVLGADYHISFYQQLPDFCMALLQQEPQATVAYAPLLFHLAGCQSCHAAYLDIYGSLQAAIYPQGIRPLLGQGTRTLAATPHRMLCHLSQTLISQAEAILRQAHREHTDSDEAARALLQMAMRVSTHIVQSLLRRQALQDLVRVATLFAGPAAPAEPQGHTFYPVLATSGRRSGRADQALHAPAVDQGIINLQSSALNGSLQQHGAQLELHLRDLPQALRGQFVRIIVPLGSLSEQIHWQGGDPQVIRSIAAVDAQGSLVTPIGETDLRLHNPEERNMIEALILQLTVQREA
jgi:hypothetical protein